MLRVTRLRIAVCMKKILVYSHDTYGLGNLRRMLAICNFLSRALPDLSILLISGSPMVHSFRLTDGVDYIKLPCLTRTERDDYSVKSLRTGLPETVKLRADLILAAAANFQPDLFLVDKKPFGVKSELKATFDFLQENLPQTKAALILRDILDTPQATMSVWQAHDYFAVINSFYDLVLVLGEPEIFDLISAYQFPAPVADKVKFCGYTRREKGAKTSAEVRKELRLADNQRLVLLTLGGGEDGYDYCAKYLAGISRLSADHNLHSLIISGPEMKAEQKDLLSQAVAQNQNITLLEFTDDLMSYLDAADVVIAMGGYNTICEILSLQKKAIIVPRAKPVQEQLMRAERMSKFGLFKYIHPAELTSENLIETLLDELNRTDKPAPQLSLDAQEKITGWVAKLLFETNKSE